MPPKTHSKPATKPKPAKRPKAAKPPKVSATEPQSAAKTAEEKHAEAWEQAKGVEIAKQILDAVAAADPLPGNDDNGEIPDDDLSYAAERRAQLIRHIEERKKITGNKPPEWVDVIYCESNDSYLYKAPGSSAFSISPEKKIMRDLKRFALSEKWRPPMTVTYSNGSRMTETPWPELEWPTANAFANRRVYYAGSLPGHKIGETQDSSGRKLYVTEQANVWNGEPELTEGNEPEFTIDLIFKLLGDTDAQHLCYMLAAWLMALREGAWQPGPVLWLVGKADSGKSLLIEAIKFLFGGRAADPSGALLPKDGKFTGHLLSGEIWAMDDPRLPPSMDDRMRLAERLKTYFHARAFTFEDKGCRSFTANCFRRSVNGINDTHAVLKGLPPMQPGVQDKNCIKRCGNAREAWESRFMRQPGLSLDGVQHGERLDQLAMIERLKKEAPFMRSYLLKSYQHVPTQWRDSRYGVKATQDVGLMRELNELSPEASFFSYFTEVTFKSATEDGGVWRYSNMSHDDWKEDGKRVDYPYILATSKEIESKLQRSEFSRRVEHQLRSTPRILEQLEEFFPSQVIGPNAKDANGERLVPMRNGANRWKINNPFRETKED